jgi:hypothetical protein
MRLPLIRLTKSLPVGHPIAATQPCLLRVVSDHWEFTPDFATPMTGFGSLIRPFPARIGP